MLVSLTSTTADATDLGYLLHKHPDRVRTVDVGIGRAHVFFPEATPQRCTATLFVEVDPIALARGTKGRPPASLEHYVNDRPYVASSMLAVALGRLFGTALSGTCDARPHLVAQPLDLEVHLPTLPVRGGERIVRRLFEPLGYEVNTTPIALDAQFPSWGNSRYHSVGLKGRQTVRAALEHLFVMLPVLDDRKHYWIGDSEVDKLLRRGGDWLKSHPESYLISRRYLRFGSLTRSAMERLAESDHDRDDSADDDAANGGSGSGAEPQGGDHELAERPISLADQRRSAVLEVVRSLGGGRVADLGCGEGRLLTHLMDEPTVTYLLGTDASIDALDRAERRLGLDEMSERRREQVSLVQGALTYADDRLRGFDIATLVEVIEHVDPERLDSLADAVFAHAAPQAVVLTTPNREFNVNYSHVGPDGMRHRDHRFEWSREEFGAWVADIEKRFGYRADISGIGVEHSDYGPPTQMAVFRR
ncbi:3' terminal RNA ribose 2'-O-methyltransferase Hen1 [Candidatus Poriferisodalis sp.]|uniref:3' terminal RNA ribose 2'-O-methyltransferase Hen1 n=1 Tax=Candidatus Poriferisodalis sp. TaxID=3101277 RepID=UPI003B029080